MRLSSLVIAAFMVIPILTYAQSVGINNTNSEPDPSAILDVNSTSQGVLFPRMSSTARTSITEPAEGLMVWDTTTNTIWGFDGTAWREISSKWEKSGSNLVNTNEGNVGIGNASPSYSLFIEQNSPSIALYDADNPSFSGVMIGDSNNLDIRASRVLFPFGSGDPGNVIIQASQNFGGGLISTAGNVGIGTYTPSDKLTLSGNMGFFSGTTRYGQVYTTAGDMVINARFGSIFGTASQDLILQTDTGGSLFSLVGRVGIGTSNPQAKLHVDGNVLMGDNVTPASGYRLSVDGKIMGEEMRIQDSGNWPDYVFEEDYPLTSLDELNVKIKSLGHLPGIPSADFVEMNGIMVGQMQKMHMEKIEELTLYILQLHERIASLEQLITTENK